MPAKVVVVTPLNLDHVIGTKWNRVQKVGVELEGGWTKLPTLHKRYKIEGDGSVFSDGAINSHPKWSSSVKKGELAIGPFQPGQVATSLKRYYPDLVDKTCGMHVHMSFTRTYEYALLTDSPVYQETVLHYLLKWANTQGFPLSHHIWDRLKGKNRYCAKEFWPYAQMVKTSKDYGTQTEHRYTAISYQWNRYRTVECRALPMMETALQATSAVKEVIKITNAYLTVTDKGRVRGGGSIELPAGESYEETLEANV